MTSIPSFPVTSKYEDITQSFNQSITQRDNVRHTKQIKEKEASGIDFFRRLHNISLRTIPYNNLQYTLIDGQENVDYRFFSGHMPGRVILRVNECNFQYCKLTFENLILLTQRVNNFFGNIKVTGKLICSSAVDNRFGSISAHTIEFIPGLNPTPATSLIDNTFGIIQAGLGGLTLDHEMLINNLGYIMSQGKLYMMLGAIDNENGIIATHQTYFIQVGLGQVENGLILGQEGSIIRQLKHPKPPHTYLLPKDLPLIAKTKVVTATLEEFWHLTQKPASIEEIEQFSQPIQERKEIFQTIARQVRKDHLPVKFLRDHNKNSPDIGENPNREKLYFNYLHHLLHGFNLSQMLLFNPQQIDLVGLDLLDLMGGIYNIPGNVRLQIGRLLGDHAALNIAGTAVLDVREAQLYKFKAICDRSMEYRTEQTEFKESMLVGKTLRVISKQNLGLKGSLARATEGSAQFDIEGSATITDGSTIMAQEEILFGREEGEKAPASLHLGAATISGTNVTVNVTKEYSTETEANIYARGNYSFDAKNYNMYGEANVEGEIRGNATGERLSSIQGTFISGGSQSYKAVNQLLVRNAAIDSNSHVTFSSDAQQTHLDSCVDAKGDVNIAGSGTARILNCNYSADGPINSTVPSAIVKYSFFESVNDSIVLNSDAENGKLIWENNRFNAHVEIKTTGFAQEIFENNCFFGKKITHDAVKSHLKGGNQWKAEELNTKAVEQLVTGEHNHLDVAIATMAAKALRAVDGSLSSTGDLNISAEKGEQTRFEFDVRKKFLFNGDNLTQIDSTTEAGSQTYELNELNVEGSVLSSRSGPLEIQTKGGTASYSNACLSSTTQITHSGKETHFGDEVISSAPTINHFSDKFSCMGGEQIFDTELLELRNKELALQNAHTYVSGNMKGAIEQLEQNSHLLHVEGQIDMEATVSALYQNSQMHGDGQVNLEGGEQILIDMRIVSETASIAVKGQKIFLGLENDYEAPEAVSVDGCASLKVHGVQTFLTKYTKIQSSQGDLEADGVVVDAAGNLALSAEQKMNLSHGVMAVAKALEVEANALAMQEQTTWANSTSIQGNSSVQIKNSQIETGTFTQPISAPQMAVENSYLNAVHGDIEFTTQTGSISGTALDAEHGAIRFTAQDQGTLNNNDYSAQNLIATAQNALNVNGIQNLQVTKAEFNSEGTLTGNEAHFDTKGTLHLTAVSDLSLQRGSVSAQECTTTAATTSLVEQIMEVENFSTTSPKKFKAVNSTIITGAWLGQLKSEEIIGEDTLFLVRSGDLTFHGDSQRMTDSELISKSGQVVQKGDYLSTAGSVVDAQHGFTAEVNRAEMKETKLNSPEGAVTIIANNSSLNGVQAEAAQAVTIIGKESNHLDHATLKSSTTVQVSSAGGVEVHKSELTAPAIAIHGEGEHAVHFSQSKTSGDSLQFTTAAPHSHLNVEISQLNAAHLKTEGFEKQTLTKVESTGQSMHLKGAAQSTTQIVKSQLKTTGNIDVETSVLINQDSLVKADQNLNLPVNEFQNRGAFIGTKISMTALNGENSVNEGSILGGSELTMSGLGSVEQKGTLSGQKVRVELHDLKEVPGNAVIAEVFERVTKTPFNYQEQNYLVNQKIHLENPQTTISKNWNLEAALNIEAQNKVEISAEVTSQQAFSATTQGVVDMKKGSVVTPEGICLGGAQGVNAKNLATNKTLHVESQNGLSSNLGVWKADRIETIGHINNFTNPGQQPPVTIANTLVTGPGNWIEGGNLEVKEMDISQLNEMKIQPNGSVSSENKLNLVPQKGVLNKGEVISPEVAIKVTVAEHLGKIETQSLSAIITDGPLKIIQDKAYGEKVVYEVNNGDITVDATLASPQVSLQAPNGTLFTTERGIIGSGQRSTLNSKKVDHKGKFYSGDAFTLCAKERVFFRPNSRCIAHGHGIIRSMQNDWIVHGSTVQFAKNLTGQARYFKEYTYLGGAIQFGAHEWNHYNSIPDNASSGMFTKGGPTNSPVNHLLTPATVTVGGNFHMQGNHDAWGSTLHVGGNFTQPGSSKLHNLVHNYSIHHKPKKKKWYQNIFGGGGGGGRDEPKTQTICNNQVVSLGNYKVAGSEFFNGGNVYGKLIDVAAKNFQNVQQRAFNGPTAPRNLPALINLEKELHKLGLEAHGAKENLDILEKFQNEIKVIQENHFNRSTAVLVGEKVRLVIENKLTNSGVIQGIDKLRINAGEIENNRPVLYETEVGTQYKSYGRKKKVAVTLQKGGEGGEILGGNVSIKAKKYTSTGGKIHGTKSVDGKIKEVYLKAFEEESLHHFKPGSRVRLCGGKGFTKRTDFLSAAITSDGTMNLKGKILDQEGSAIISQGDFKANFSEKSSQRAAMSSYMHENKKSVFGTKQNERAIIQPSLFGSVNGNTILKTGKGGIEGIGCKYFAGPQSHLKMSTKGDLNLDVALKQLKSKRTKIRIQGVGTEYYRTSLTNMAAEVSEVSAKKVSLIAEGQINASGAIIRSQEKAFISGDKGVNLVAKEIIKQMKHTSLTVAASCFMSDALVKLATGAPTKEVLSSLVHEHGITGSLYDLFSSKSASQAVCGTIMAAIQIANLGSALLDAFNDGGMDGLKNAITNQLGITDEKGKFKPRVTIRAGVSQTESTWNDYYSTFVVGSRIEVISKYGAVVTGGTILEAGEGGLLVQGKEGVINIPLQFRRNTTTEGLGLSATFGGGDNAGVAVGFDFHISESDSATQLPSRFSGKRIKVVSGANIEAHNLDIKSQEEAHLKAENKITVASYVDTHKSESTSGSIKMGSGGVSGSYSHSKQDQGQVCTFAGIQGGVIIFQAEEVVLRAVKLTDLDGNLHKNVQYKDESGKTQIFPVVETVDEWKDGRKISFNLSYQAPKNPPANSTNKEDNKTPASNQGKTNKNTPNKLPKNAPDKTNKNAQGSVSAKPPAPANRGAAIPFVVQGAIAHQNQQGTLQNSQKDGAIRKSILKDSKRDWAFIAPIGDCERVLDDLEKVGRGVSAFMEAVPADFKNDPKKVENYRKYLINGESPEAAAAIVRNTNTLRRVVDGSQKIDELAILDLDEKKSRERDLEKEQKKQAIADAKKVAAEKAQKNKSLSRAEKAALNKLTEELDQLEAEDIAAMEKERNEVKFLSEKKKQIYFAEEDYKSSSQANEKALKRTLIELEIALMQLEITTLEVLENEKNAISFPDEQEQALNKFVQPVEEQEAQNSLKTFQKEASGGESSSMAEARAASIASGNTPLANQLNDARGIHHEPAPEHVDEDNLLVDPNSFDAQEPLPDFSGIPISKLTEAQQMATDIAESKKTAHAAALAKEKAKDEASNPPKEKASDPLMKPFENINDLIHASDKERKGVKKTTAPSGSLLSFGESAMTLEDKIERNMAQSDAKKLKSPPAVRNKDDIKEKDLESRLFEGAHDLDKKMADIQRNYFSMSFWEKLGAIAESAAWNETQSDLLYSAASLAQPQKAEPQPDSSLPILLDNQTKIENLIDQTLARPTTGSMDTFRKIFVLSNLNEIKNDLGESIAFHMQSSHDRRDHVDMIFKGFTDLTQLAIDSQYLHEADKCGIAAIRGVANAAHGIFSIVTRPEESLTNIFTGIDYVGNGIGNSLDQGTFVEDSLSLLRKGLATPLHEKVEAMAEIVAPMLVGNIAAGAGPGIGRMLAAQGGAAVGNLNAAVAHGINAAARMVPGTMLTPAGALIGGGAVAVAVPVAGVATAINGLTLVQDLAVGGLAGLSVMNSRMPAKNPAPSSSAPSSAAPPRRHTPRRVQGPHGVCEDVPYHGLKGNDIKSAGPTNLEETFKNAVSTGAPKANEGLADLVSYDPATNEIVIFKHSRLDPATQKEFWHAHVLEPKKLGGPNLNAEREILKNNFNVEKGKYKGK